MDSLLDKSLESLKGIGVYYQKKLVKLRLKTVRDLLRHFPNRYEDFSNLKKINEVVIDEVCSVFGKIEKIKTRKSFKKRLFITEAILTDQTGKIDVVWFGQPFLMRSLKAGILVIVSGKVTQKPASVRQLTDYGVARDNKTFFQSPVFEVISRSADKLEEAEIHFERLKHTGGLIPVYPETKGLTSRGIRFLIKPAIDASKNLPDFLPHSVIEQAGLIDFKIAIQEVHFPSSLQMASSARQRFAFEEIFLTQFLLLEARAQNASFKAPQIPMDIEFVKSILAELDFELTQTQKSSLWEIIKDLNRKYPMNRLLNGDVGSGKTIVVLIALALVVKSGWQGVLMAPTEILSRQHFQTAMKILKNLGIEMALLVSKQAKIASEDLEGEIAKPSLKKIIASGKPILVIGTQAVLQKDIDFPKLGLVVVDEQHRFGVKQRAQLVKGGFSRIDAPIGADIRKTELLYKDLTYKVRGAIFNVYNELGFGLKENIYQRALTVEFERQGIVFEPEKDILIKYHNASVGEYKPDFIIDNKIILEIKSVSTVGRVEKKQVWDYLKKTDYRLALLVNFGADKLKIERVIYDSSRDNQLESALNQRESALVPHFLSMSATPIPRTLALGLWGDLDISIISEMPKNRKRITTRLMTNDERQELYGFIRERVSQGEQVFIICPRIEKPDVEFDYQKFLNLDAKAVKEEFTRLKDNIFPDLKLGILHGKMKPQEKEKTMAEFSENKLNILVSTSVIEVGIDVPNATVMVVEGADFFGLAQLHQFRGRVGRGEKQSYCFLLTETESKTAQERLKAFADFFDGFSLAEEDLKLRGPGQFFGVKQSGIPDMATNTLKDLKLVIMARKLAEACLSKLDKLPLLKNELESFRQRVHLE